MASNSEKIYNFAEKAYFILLGGCVAIVIFFAYLTWIFYQGTKGTTAQLATIVVALPILIAILLIFMLITFGKKASIEELAEFMQKS